MIYSILLFTASFALDANVKQHVKAHGTKLRAPDDDEYNFAEDDDDDPSNFSSDQFLDTEDGDAFLQTQFKDKIKSAARAKSIKEDENEHYFNTVKGEDEAVDDDDNPQYDDAFVQIALKSHVEFNKQMANKMKTAPNFLQKKSGAPDDDEYNFAEDDDDNPADFGVGQFLDNDDDDDDDDDLSFIQVYTPSEDNEYGDDRLGGEYVSAEEFEESDDQDENDDAAFMQEEALGHPHKHQHGKKHKDHHAQVHHKHHKSHHQKGHSKKVAATEIDSVVKQAHLNHHDPAGDQTHDATYDPAGDHTHDATYDPAGDHTHDATYDPAGDATHDATYDPAGDHTHDATYDPAGDATYEVAATKMNSGLEGAKPKKKGGEKKGEKKKSLKNHKSVLYDVMHDPAGDHTHDATYDPAADHTHDATYDPAGDATYEVAAAKMNSGLEGAKPKKKGGEKKDVKKKSPKNRKSSLLGVTDVYKQLEELKALEKSGKLRDDHGWTAVDDEDQEEDENNRGSFLQMGDDEEDDGYGDDRLDGGM